MFIFDLAWVSQPLDILGFFLRSCLTRQTTIENNPVTPRYDFSLLLRLFKCFILMKNQPLDVLGH